MFTFSVKLEKCSFHVGDLPRTGKKCTEMKKAREGRAKLLICFIKYATFVALSLPSRRSSLLAKTESKRAQAQKTSAFSIVLGVKK